LKPNAGLGEDKRRYFVYILACENNCLYTGYTTNIIRRYGEHLKGHRNSKFTRANRPVKLICCWQLRANLGDVLRLEFRIKSLSRAEKEHLIHFPDRIHTLIPHPMGHHHDKNAPNGAF